MKTIDKDNLTEFFREWDFHSKDDDKLHEHLSGLQCQKVDEYLRRVLPDIIWSFMEDTRPVKVKKGIELRCGETDNFLLKIIAERA